MKTLAMTFILLLTAASNWAYTRPDKASQDTTANASMPMLLHSPKPTRFIQEQVHVMTDRELYMPTDTIWLNAWVVKATTKQPARYSNYLYVELRDAGGFLKKRVRLRTAAPGKFTGYLPLSEKLTSNTYTLVAYTYHMLCTDETLFFKKPIDIISPLDMNNGITLSSLRNHEETEHFRLVRRDSTVIVDFDIPEAGQYAASVTNVFMNPADSTSFITNTLPYMPLLYTDGNVPDSVLSFPYEQGSVVSGTVYGNFFTKKPQDNIEVNLIGISENYIDNTHTDKNGRFLFNVPDIFSTDDIAGYMVQARTRRAHTIKENITFDTLPFPEMLRTFVPEKNHFIRLSKQEVGADEQTLLWTSDKKYRRIIMLDDVTVTGSREASRKYNTFADKSICVDGDDGVIIHNFSELATMLGLRIEYDAHGLGHFVDTRVMSFNQSAASAASIVDVYVDGMSYPEYDIAMLDGMFPMDIVKRVDKLSPNQAMMLSERGFKTNYVLSIVLKNADEIAKSGSPYSNFRIAKQMACQKQADFKFTETHYAPPVIYWNPSVTAIQPNKARIVFRTPHTSRSFYRITLEGITDSGIPVHQEKYIKIAE